MASECLRGNGGTNDGMGAYAIWGTLLMELVGDGVPGRNPPVNFMISERGEKFPFDRPEGNGGGGGAMSTTGIAP